MPKLRQLNGLPGTPDVSTPLIATNTGSLGMGISKAYGMARANRYTRPHRPPRRDDRRRRAAGRPDLGWLQPVADERLAQRVSVIVDHNELQSDTAVRRGEATSGRRRQFRAFGWEVRRGDGHDFALSRERSPTSTP